MFLWVGSSSPSNYLNDLFGVTGPHQLDPGLSDLPELDNPVSRRVRGIIKSIRQQRKHNLRVSIAMFFLIKKFILLMFLLTYIILLNTFNFKNSFNIIFN